jgi:hypothetical protein
MLSRSALPAKTCDLEHEVKLFSGSVLRIIEHRAAIPTQTLQNIGHPIWSTSTLDLQAAKTIRDSDSADLPGTLTDEWDTDIDVTLKAFQ